MITIYHNPRCSKSRQGVAYLTEAGVEFETVLYLKDPLDQSTIKTILKKLNCSPIELIRKGESVWKEHFKGKELSDEQLIDAMIEQPKLIERPIIVKGAKAVIGRPTQLIDQLL